uniref:LRRCT domain-containing protein n=1 Tax=Gopherus evgoodei TaxID=1825980 RepID=A0A8C4YHB9_9SAUR
MGCGGPWACVPLFVLLLLLAAGGERHRPPRWKCPIVCSCTQDNALCDRTDGVPRGLPPDITSLSLVRSGFTELREGSFLQTPSLQLLSLAHNQLETLPRHLFRGLDALTHVDLRGNPFHCDCRIKWLVEWLSSTNASAELGECQGPGEVNGTQLSQLHLQDFDCITTALALFQSLPFQALSVEPFWYQGEQHVAITQPFAGCCSLLEWDHLDGAFRAYASINAPSPHRDHPPQAPLPSDQPPAAPFLPTEQIP